MVDTYPRRSRRQLELSLVRDSDGDSNLEVRDETGTILNPSILGGGSGGGGGATDAQLRDRSTHTGTQPANTVTETATQKWMTANERTKLTGMVTTPSRRAAPVCGEIGNESTVPVSNGTNTGANTMMVKTLPPDVSLSFWSLRYSGAKTVFQGGDADINNVIPHKASVSLSATGPWIPVSTKGLRVISMDGGTYYDTDPFYFHVPAGGQVYIKTYVNVPSAGMVWPIHNPAGAKGTTYWTSQSASESDLTGNTAAFTTTTGTAPFTPVALVDHEAPRNRASLYIAGDSIASGLKDNNIGFVHRAMNGTMCYQRSATSGVTLQHFAAPTTNFRRLALARGCNVAFEMLGTNDLNGGRTLAQLQADKVSLWLQLAASGMPVFTGTIPPWTDSTDAWVSIANQTPKALEANRVGLNDWIRAGAAIDPSTKAPVANGTAGALVRGAAGHPLTGYFETADTVESARNSGRWKLNPGDNARLTDDGVHPLDKGHILMATAIDLSVIRAAVAAV